MASKIVFSKMLAWCVCIGNPHSTDKAQLHLISTLPLPIPHDICNWLWLSVPYLLTWFNFNPSIDNYLYGFLGVGWNCLSIANSAAAAVWQWIRYPIPHFTGQTIYYQCCALSWAMSVKMSHLSANFRYRINIKQGAILLKEITCNWDKGTCKQLWIFKGCESPLMP